MSVRITSFEPELAGHFERLNVEWLEKFFVVEPIDREVLQSAAAIIDHGGDILFAWLDDEVVGCCALKHQGDQVFELTKMAVTAAAQGHGIGRKLMTAALARYRELAGTRLYLESNDSLTAAITLYESVGFRHEPPPGGPSIYERANVYMVYHSD